MNGDSITKIAASIHELRNSILSAIVPEDAQKHIRLAAADSRPFCFPITRQLHRINGHLDIR
jgi:hypothetical protein